MMGEQAKAETSGVTGPQTPRNPNAGEIEENVEEKGGGPVGVEIPPGREPDDEGKPTQD
jgi:hypothetical protein